MQRDVERHAVVLRGKRFQIGADLVRHIAICRDAIGADDAQIDFAMLHQMAAGIVGDDGMRHTMRTQLERSQRRALIAWARFIDPDMERQSCVMGHVDRRKRSPPIDARKPAGVAMGEDVEAFTLFFCAASRKSFSPCSPMRRHVATSSSQIAAASRQAMAARSPRGRLRTASRMRFNAQRKLTAVGRVASNAS